MKLYEKLADDIERLIRQGVYRHGDRIPSVRQASQQHRISITTVLHAYLLLESRGLLESRPQSGYFVNLRRDDSHAPVRELRPSKPIAISSSVDVSRLVLSTLRSIGTDDAVPLGSPYPDPSLFPFEKLNRYSYTARPTQSHV
ncbi:GntR family transcriptional regulator, partial [Burkholderia cenocepacia]|uniref:GntR family transcriptional regulator n=1 Tax=Burkholderia cenocepacia TaxID=95486 RepID=UPI001177E3F6